MANETYITNIGTTVIFNGAGGGNVAFGIEGLANGAGRISAQHDWGVVARPYIFKWNFKTQIQATPNLDSVVDIYIATAPDDLSSRISGNEGVSDAALGDIKSVDNMRRIGRLIVADTTANTDLTCNGYFECLERYMSIVIVNRTGASLNATAANSEFRITKASKQGQ